MRNPVALVVARTESAGVRNPVAASELRFSLVSRQLPLESRVHRTLPARLCLTTPSFCVALPRSLLLSR